MTHPKVGGVENGIGCDLSHPRINIRLYSRDLRALQKRAMEEGVPYQTLVASILHKYVEGRLRDSG